MYAMLGRRLRRLVGRETELDRALSEWGLLRGELRRRYGMQGGLGRGGFLDYFEFLAASVAPEIPADPPTRVRVIALEVFENTLYHGGRPHSGCDCKAYLERAEERNGEVLAGGKPRPVRFVSVH
jgi:hypothetical protein